MWLELANRVTVSSLRIYFKKMVGQRGFVGG